MNTPEVALKHEMDAILAKLGSTNMNDEQKSEAYDRIGQISDQLVAISKRGDASLYIINILPRKYIPNGSWRVARSYASFQIAGPGPGEPYAVTEITGYKARIDTGRGGQASGGGGWRVKLDSYWIKAQDVANDLVGEVNGDLPSLASDPRCKKTLGCFVSPTRIPSPELLEKHKAELHVYLAALVADGNAEWRKTKDYRKVSDLSRMAAELLGVSTEWHEDFSTLEPCPACGTNIKPKVVKCLSCGAILDRKKAIEFGLIEKERVASR